jgi:uncharacterized radical SAM superfamily protein
MDVAVPETLPDGLESQLEAAWRVRQAHFAPRITCAYPVDTALVSVTGARCALDCAHCGGHYLRHMQPIDEAQVEGASSVLISGGCDPHGRVPVLDALQWVAKLRGGQGAAADRSPGASQGGGADRVPGRKLNWHVGLIDEPTAAAISAALAPGVDTISFDVVGDRQTIEECYGLDATPALYEATYRMLRRYARVVPHITIGLRGGELGHERPAMELLSRSGLDALVLIVFIPTPNTRYADRAPPTVEQVAGLLAEARQRFPDVLLQLGCMRPRRAYRAQLDPLAVRAGVNVIVSPSREGRAAAEALGLQVVQTRECCVFV